MKQFREFKVHFSGTGTKRKHNGFDYAVYPVVMLVEGVHHGAIGNPVFYPSEVIAASVQDWERMPIPVYHPQDNSGEYLLCNDPIVSTEWSIGWLENPKFVDGKLKADAWINIELAKQKQPGLLEALDANEPMDVSTGLLALDDGVPGTWNGEQYSSSITEIIPDHLALLPGAQGACSWDDGCGVRANIKLNQEDKNKMKTKVVLAVGGTVEIEPGKIKEYLASAVHVQNELSHEGIANQLYQFVDGLDIRGSDGNYVSMHMIQAVYDDHFVYSQRTDQGRKLFKRDFQIDADDKVVIGDDISEVREDLKYIPVTNETIQVKTNTEEKKMAEKTCCPKKVAALIANEKSAFTDADKEFLEGLTEDQLDKIVNSLEMKEEKKVETVPVVNTAVKVDMKSYLESAPDEIRAVLNAGLRELDNKRNDLMKQIMENPNNMFKEDQLRAMDTQNLEAIAHLAKQAVAVETPAYFGANGSFTPNSTEPEEAYVPVTMFNKKQ